MTDYGIRTPFGASLALQSLAYRAMGHQGQSEDAPLLDIPKRLWRRCVECKSPVDDLEKTICDHCERSMDGETDDTRHNDPRTKQAAWINSQR